MKKTKTNKHQPLDLWVWGTCLVLATFAWISAASAQTYIEHTYSGITFGHQVNGSNLDIKVSCPTTGWVAVGFDPSNMMADANILIGYVDASGAHVRDDFGDSKKTHKADTVLGGSDNVTNVSGTELNGVTTLFFTIPLDSGDKKDVALALNKQHTLILACGKNGKDDYTSMHQKFAVDKFVIGAK